MGDQLGERQVVRLATCEDRLDDPGREKRQRQTLTDEGERAAAALGEGGHRCARAKLCCPSMRQRDGADQCFIRPGCNAADDETGFDASALDLKGRGEAEGGCSQIGFLHTQPICERLRRDFQLELHLGYLASFDELQALSARDRHQLGHTSFNEGRGGALEDLSAGCDEMIADSLSKLRFELFRRQAPAIGALASAFEKAR